MHMLKNSNRLQKAFVSACIVVFLCLELGFAQQAAAPLYRDPITDGAADPALVYNHKERAWWMLYTQRRANAETAGVAYCYGNKIGIASSDDHGKTWVYRGVLDLDFEAGHNTFWAPDVVYVDSLYHLYVSYTQGVRTQWGGSPVLMHYTSRDLWQWTLQGPLELGSSDVIDPTLFRQSNSWYMWYKDSKHPEGNIALAKSSDLYHWQPEAEAVIKGHGQEGAKVFQFQNYYWMLTDEWAGMRVYRSSDLKSWEKQGKILADRGTRKDDTPEGAHGDVVVTEDKAFVIYFTHPDREKHTEAPEDAFGNIPYKYRRSSIQVAELWYENGTLKAKRNEPFDFFLP